MSDDPTADQRCGSRHSLCVAGRAVVCARDIAADHSESSALTSRGLEFSSGRSGVFGDGTDHSTVGHAVGSRAGNFKMSHASPQMRLERTYVDGAAI
jgi:hypothetical protein